jgi:DNA-binding MarR family transcriptional regulator
MLKRQPMSALETSSILELEKSSVSRNLELMRGNGWIGVAASGRRVTLRVAPLVEAIYRAALPSWKQAQKRSLDILGNEGEKSLSNITRRIKKRPSHERG